MYAFYTGGHLLKFLKIMRIGICLMLLINLSVNAEVFSQKTKVTLDMEQRSMLEIIQELRETCDYQFLFQVDELKPYNKRDLKVKDAELKEVMQKLLQGTHLTWRIEDEIILIKAGKPSVAELFPQMETIRGKVRDTEGKPLPGVTVLVKGTNRGVATDIDGEFQLNVANRDVILIFSFVGMTKQEVRYTGQKILEVTMSGAATEMGEVMVTGYQTLPKERVTGAFSYIGSKQLEKTSSFNLKDKIEGLVPGLYFQPNYDEDQNPTSEKSRSIVIRGVSTFGNNNPLIVVDGFPASEASDPWENINPDDVESITVLKDAAAASIWGAQAANGVIVITTKKGKSDAPQFNASVDFMAQPVPDLFKIPWASSKDAVDIYKWMILEKDYMDGLLQDENYKKYDMPEVIRTLVDMKRGTLSTSEGNAKLDELSHLDVRNEFKKLFFRSMETNTKVNISFQANSKNNNIRTSVTALSNNKYSRGDSRLDIMLNMNDQYRPKPWLEFAFGTNLSFSSRKNNGIAVNELSYIPQMSGILGKDGEYLPMIKNNPDDSYYTAPTTSRQDSVNKYNLPYDWNWNLKREQNNKDNTDKNTDLRLNAKINLKPIEGLNLELSYQYQYINNFHREYFNEESWTVRNTVNNNARPDRTLPVPPGGMLYENKRYGYSHDIRAQFVYDKTFNIHTVRLMGGIEVRKDYYDEVPNGYYGYDPQSLIYNTDINFKDPVDPKMSGVYTYYNNIPYIPSKNWFSISGRDDRFLSYYGNAGYTFNDRYDLTGSIRLDKTNLYGQAPSYQNLPQWSVGLGWDMLKEELFQQVCPYMNYMKLRFSYGWNGNIDKSASPYIYGYPWTDPVTQLPYAAVQRAPNPTLTWEKTATYNIGLDFSALSDRINGSFNFYVKQTKDVLTDMAVNGTYGFQNNQATLNAGEIHNKGVEFDISALVVNREVKWYTMFNYSYNKNRVKKITLVSQSLSAYTNMAFYYHKPNQPVSYIAAVHSAGYDEKGMPKFYYGDQILSVTDVENNSQLDPEKLFEFVGQRDPKHFGSWTNSVSYKGLEFSIRLLYKFGHKFIGDYPTSGMVSNYMTGSKYFTFLPQLMADRWKSPSDANTARMYSLENKITNSYQVALLDCVSRYNTGNVLNAGQIRLQNISLAYSIPDKYLSVLRLSNVRLMFEARNLGPIVRLNKQGIDPDNPAYSSSTYGALMYVVRNRPEYSIGLRIGF